MHIYKFRLLSEENENLLRDVEIKATQTFEDFHNIIVDSVNLNDKQLASFHICDQKWNKLKEITLIEMMDGSEEEEGTKPIEEIYVMSDSRIKDFINEPSQRLLYEYDFLNLKTFYIELISVFKQKEQGPYPRCTNKRGDLKEETVTGEFLDDDEDVRSQLLQDYEDLLDDTLENPG